MKNFTYKLSIEHDERNGREFVIMIKYGPDPVEIQSFTRFKDVLEFVKNLEDAKIHREVFHD